MADYNFALERKYAFPRARADPRRRDAAAARRHVAHAVRAARPRRGKEVQRELLLRGESANAGRLITLLEDSQLFTQAAPRSPTTKIQPGPGEIFDLGAQLKPLPPPPASADRGGQRERTGGARRRAAAARPAPAAPAAPAPRARCRDGRRPRRPAPRRPPMPRRPRRPLRRAGRADAAGDRRAGDAARRRPAGRAAPPPRPGDARRRRRGGTPVNAPRNAPPVPATNARRSPAPNGGAQSMTPAFAAADDARAPAAARARHPADRRSRRWSARWSVPVLLLHRHYDLAIDDLGDRLERYRRVAAQAPELRTRARCDAQTRRPHVLPASNTAPNLAAAELQELVRGAIENNGGRITTSQNPRPRDDGRFKQIGVNVQFFATTPALAEDPRTRSRRSSRTSSSTTSPCGRSTRSAASSPAPGQEPELNVQLDVGAGRYPEPAKPAAAAPANDGEDLTMNRDAVLRRTPSRLADLARALRRASRCCSAGRPTGAATLQRVPRLDATVRRSRSRSRCCPSTRSPARRRRAPRHGRAHAFQPDAPPGAAGAAAGRRRADACQRASSRSPARPSSTARPPRSCARSTAARRAACSRARRSTACWSPRSSPTACASRSAATREELTLKIADRAASTTIQPAVARPAAAPPARRGSRCSCRARPAGRGRAAAASGRAGRRGRPRASAGARRAPPRPPPRGSRRAAARHAAERPRHRRNRRAAPAPAQQPTGRPAPTRLAGRLPALPAAAPAMTRPIRSHDDDRPPIGTAAPHRNPGQQRCVDPLPCDDRSFARVSLLLGRLRDAAAPDAPTPPKPGTPSNVTPSLTDAVGRAQDAEPRTNARASYRGTGVVVKGQQPGGARAAHPADAAGAAAASCSTSKAPTCARSCATSWATSSTRPTRSTRRSAAPSPSARRPAFRAKRCRRRSRRCCA